jgi:hypothetical protein
MVISSGCGADWNPLDKRQGILRERPGDWNKELIDFPDWQAVSTNRPFGMPKSRPWMVSSLNGKIHVLVLDTGIHAGITVFWTQMNLKTAVGTQKSRSC